MAMTYQKMMLNHQFGLASMILRHNRLSKKQASNALGQLHTGDQHGLAALRCQLIVALNRGSRNGGTICPEK